MSTSHQPEICEQTTAELWRTVAKLTQQRDAALAWVDREHRAFLRVCLSLALMTVVAGAGWIAFGLKGWRP